jgi:Carboxypeptidase regulatory-like domain
MKTIRVSSIIFLAVIACLFTFVEKTASSQRGENAQVSHIEGVVLDVNNASIVGATINIKNVDFSRKLQSDDEGKFAVELPPGTYQISVEQPGFKRFHLTAFRANAGTRELVNIHMEVEPPQSTVKAHSD